MCIFKKLTHRTVCDNKAKEVNERTTHRRRPLLYPMEQIIHVTIQHYLKRNLSLKHHQLTVRVSVSDIWFRGFGGNCAQAWKPQSCVTTWNHKTLWGKQKIDSNRRWKSTCEESWAESSLPLLSVIGGVMPGKEVLVKIGILISFKIWIRIKHPFRIYWYVW